MAENKGTYLENTKPPLELGNLERQELFPNIHFEPAFHPNDLDMEGYKAIENRFNAGDLTAHIWNPEVALRMKSYNPQVIGIDSLAAIRYILDNTKEGVPSYHVADEQKAKIWIGLPARPNELNNIGVVHVVCGDIEDYRDLAAAIYPNKTPLEESDKATLKLQDEDRSFIEGLSYLEEQQNELRTRVDTLTPLAEIGLLYGVLRSGLAALDSVRQKKEISRRNLLKGAALTAAFLALHTKGKPFLQQQASQSAGLSIEVTQTQTELEKDLLEKVITLTKPQLKDADMLNGRTALIAAKEEDAMRELGLPGTTPGAIVMGATHAWDGESVMSNKQERVKVMYNYAMLLVAALKNVMTSIGYPESQRDQAINTLLDQISTGTAFKVTDPGGPSKNTELSKMLDTMIVKEKTFKSQQVLDSISSLRPK